MNGALVLRVCGAVLPLLYDPQLPGLVPPPDPEPFDPVDWAYFQFSSAELGDRRRTHRLVTVAAQAAAHPSGSLPQQTTSWADCKAAYGLFSHPKVSFERVCETHWQQTQQRDPGTYLLLEDTTEINFGGKRQIAGATQLGNGSGLGFLLHSALCASPDTEEVYGLAGQRIHYRQPTPAGESYSQRLKRADRESCVWINLIDQIGAAPAAVHWVHVLDRGGDNFEVFCHIRTHGGDAVVRASSMQRHVVTATGDKQPLAQYLQQLPSAGSYVLHLRARKDQPARDATLEVRFGSLTMPRPTTCSAYAKTQAPLTLQVVWVRETQAPKGVTPIAWVLYTTLPVSNFAEAQRIIGYYEKRWLIEEWHKALKTGCGAEQRQLKRAQALEALVGLLGIVAVRLLRLRALARTQPECPALTVVPALYVVVLQGLRGKAGAVWTVRDFFRALAQEGGFLCRKGDGEPGWQTIWRGWESLQRAVRGYQVAQRALGTKLRIYQDHQGDSQGQVDNQG